MTEHVAHLPTDQEPANAALDVEDLCVVYRRGNVMVSAVDGVSLRVNPGTVVGVVGESGSGKTSLASAVSGMLNSSTRVGGRIRLGADDLLNASPSRMRELRGNRIALVPQNPMSSLTPVLTIGRQMTEAVRAHARVNTKQARETARVALERVRVPDARRVFDQYPHELSGGMRQRILIAMALLHQPAVVIADEPTSALDTTVQRQIIDVLADGVRTTGSALLLISHDLAVIGQIADDVCVMFAGQIVESGPAEVILNNPRHPYTAVLLAAVDDVRDDVSDGVIEGAARPRTPGDIPTESSLCRFLHRCPRAVDACARRPPEMVRAAGGQKARCLLLEGMRP